MKRQQKTRSTRWKATPHPRGKGQPELELTESSDDEVHTRTSATRTLAYETPARRNKRPEEKAESVEETPNQESCKQKPPTLSEDEI